MMCNVNLLILSVQLMCDRKRKIYFPVFEEMSARPNQRDSASVYFIEILRRNEIERLDDLHKISSL